MKFIFSRTPTIGSHLIRLATAKDGWTMKGGWSHAANLLPNGGVIDSMAGHGVRPPRSLSSYLSAFPDHKIIEVKLPYEERGDAWALTQIGAGYDTRGLWYHLVGRVLTGSRNWQEDGKWFCSEYGAMRFIMAGGSLPEKPYGVSPNDLAAACGLKPE